MELTYFDGGVGSKKNIRPWLWTGDGKVLAGDEEGKKMDPGKHRDFYHHFGT